MKDVFFIIPLIQVFDGNNDKDTVVSHDVNPPITARYIRFRPVEWRGNIAMRVELYGCHGNVKILNWLLIDYVRDLHEKRQPPPVSNFYLYSKQVSEMNKDSYKIPRRQNSSVPVSLKSSTVFHKLCKFKTISVLLHFFSALKNNEVPFLCLFLEILIHVKLSLSKS